VGVAHGLERLVAELASDARRAVRAVVGDDDHAVGCPGLLRERGEGHGQDAAPTTD
jgi:hypothetical protein